MCRVVAAVYKKGRTGSGEARRIRFVKETVRLRGSETVTVYVRGSPQRESTTGRFVKEAWATEKQELCEGQGFPFQAPFLADSISRIPSTELKTALAS